MSVSSFVESVEYIEVSFGTGDTTSSGFLTKSQNYQNCIPFMTLHQDGTNDYTDAMLFDMYFSGTTSSGVINFERVATRSTAATVKCYVVEFNPSQVDVQQGSFSITSGNTTDNATIPTPLNDINKTAVVFSWNSDYASSALSNILVKGHITTTSGIEFYRGVSGDNCYGHWFTFEDIGDNFTVTHIDSSYTGNYYEAVAISGTNCIDPNRMFILGSYASDYSSSYAARTTSAIGLASDGSIKNERYYTAGYIYWCGQIIEFTDTSKVYVPLSSDSLVLNLASVGSPYTIDVFPYCNTNTTTAIVGSMQGICSTSYSSAAGNDCLCWSYEVVTSSGIKLEFSDSVGTNFMAPYITAVDWAGITVSSGTNDSVIPEGSGEDQSFVKSVENLSVNMTDDNVNIFLTKGQNWQNCALFVSSRADSSEDDNIKNYMVNVYFTDEGVLRLKKPPNSLSRVVEVSVVEFWPGQVKVQQKRVFTNNNTTTNVIIDEVSSTNKCFITSTVFPSGATYYVRDVLPRVNFATTSGIDIYIFSNASTSYQVDVTFFVVEDLGSNFVVAHNTSDSVGFYYDYYYDENTYYSMGNTISLFNYTSNAGSSYASRNFYGGYYDYEYRPLAILRYYSSDYVYWHGMAVRFLGNKRHTFSTLVEFTTATDSITGTYPAGFIPHANALSCFNTMQGSIFAVNYSSSAGLGHAFNTAKITNYTTGTYEVSRASSVDVDTVGNISVVDWIGYLPTASGTQTKTRTMIRSLQTVYDTNSYYDTYFEVPLTKGQDAEQCLPIVTNSCTQPGYLYDTNLYKVVYRYGDKFLVRFTAPRDEVQYTTNREINIQIVEFDDEVTIQYGTASMSALSTSVTISGVNLDRAFLVFYSTVDKYYASGNRNATICGRFSSSSELSFERSFHDNGNATISWYVVECSESSDYWTVQHSYDTDLGSDYTISVALAEHPNIYKSWFFSSWSMSNSSAFAPYSTFKGRCSYDNTAVFVKYSGSYLMDRCNVEVVTFTDGFHSDGMRVKGIETSFSSGTSMDVTVNTISGSSFDISRSIVWNMNAGNESMVTLNNANAYCSAYICQKFKDENTITISKGYASVSECFSFVCEFPEYNKYYMEGYVKEEGSGVSREVRAFRGSTGQLVDSTTSSGNGYFWLETPYGEEHFVVAFDDDAGDPYNHLIYGRVVPTVISGSFAYNEGLVTTSGFEIGVPLGRQ